MPRVVPSQVVDLIDKIFPKARTATEQENFVINRENSHAIAGLLEVINQLPSEFITVTGETYMECMVSIAALRTMQNQWIQYDRVFDSVPGLRRLNPVALIRHALAQCQDECPSGETSELQFVSDPEFRQQLRLDITATNSAIMNGEWKAATVLAGSVIESLCSGDCCEKILRRSWKRLQNISHKKRTRTWRTGFFFNMWKSPPA